MRVQWDGLIVCPPCCDPRPPELTPPAVYPEGLPVWNPRPPQDGPETQTAPENTFYLNRIVTAAEL